MTGLQIFALVLVLFIILMFFSPKTYEKSRSITVDATESVRKMTGMTVDEPTQATTPNASAMAVANAAAPSAVAQAAAPAEATTEVAAPATATAPTAPAAAGAPTPVTESFCPKVAQRYGLCSAGERMSEPYTNRYGSRSYLPF